MTSAGMVISCWLVGLVGKLRASCGCMAVRWVTGWVAGWLSVGPCSLGRETPPNQHGALAIPSLPTSLTCEAHPRATMAHITPHQRSVLRLKTPPYQDTAWLHGARAGPPGLRGAGLGAWSHIQRACPEQPQAPCPAHMPDRL